MANYSLLIKIALLAYSAWSYFKGPFDDAALLISALLFLAAAAFLSSSFVKTGIRLCMTGLSIIIVCSFFNLFPDLILFVPVLTFDLISYLKVPSNIPLSGLALLPGFPFAFSSGIEGAFFLTAVFSFILLLASRQERKIIHLEDQNRDLRINNSKLAQNIEHHESLEQQLAYTAQLEERSRLAQEIHDKVGHSISGSLMQLEAIKVIAAADPPKASVMLQNVIDTLRKGLDSIRLTLRNTKPPVEQIGINRLRLTLDEFGNKNLIKTFLSHEGDLSRITPLMWKIFTDNTLEALTNVLRHSKADRVHISIHVMNRIIRFQIKDNGVFTGTVTRGLGLAGMEERVTAINGRLIIDNSDGFCITMLIPDEVVKNADKGSAG